MGTPGQPSASETILIRSVTYGFMPSSAGVPAPPSSLRPADLLAAGLDPALHVAPEEAECLLQAAAPIPTWNLGALRSAARARPGAVVELANRDGSRGAAALALPEHAPPPLAAPLGPAAWRLTPGARTELLLLDRDGTLIEDRHYLADPDGVTLLPGAGEGLAALTRAGVPLAIVTNQSGVGRGMITTGELALVHARLEALLEREGVILAGIHACPHTPDDHCGCRKPEPGLAIRAAQALNLGLRHAVVAGDRREDLGLAAAIGVPGVLVLTGEGPVTLERLGVREPAAGPSHQPHYLVDDLPELARLLRHPSGLPVLEALAPAGAPA